jgi:hypothetical protein
MVEPVEHEDPGVVAVILSDATALPRTAVAAEVLRLAASGAVAIDGITSERFTLRVRDESRVGSPPERAVFQALARRAATQANGTVVGPPLWEGSIGDSWRPYRREVMRLARDKGYVTRLFPPVAIVAASGATALTPQVSGHAFGAIEAVAALILIAIFGGLYLVAGWGLTERGKAARAHWEALSRQLKATEELQHVGAPAVAVWAEHLPYAVVMGAAPKVAEALSPRLGGERLGLRGPRHA